MTRIPLSLFSLLLWLSPSSLLALNNLISLEIEVDEVAQQIQFSWERDDDNGPAMEIARRIEGDTSAATWIPQISASRETTTWTDTAVDPAVIYEYKFFVPTDEDYLYGTAVYASCGIEAPLIDDRGIALLVVDQTLSGTLADELQRYEMDLAGDGWTVQRLDFGRDGSATAEDLRAEIQSRHATSPISSIILFGRLPYAISGLVRPDGHDFYQQATDLFFGDVDGIWTDELTTNEPDQRNHEAGDGKYDQSSIPLPNHRIEIPVGRIDLAGMVAWDASEAELLRRYLEKNHNFRHLRYTVPRDGYFTNMALDESPVEAAAVFAMCGPENSYEIYDGGGFEQSRPLLWGIAGRDWNGSNYPDYQFKSQFTVNFASGKQMWEAENNQMRAMLALPWYGLTCCWGVRPNWQLHHTGMGATMGYSNFRTVNNTDNADPSAGFDYPPIDDFDGRFDGYIHLNLMGDPTLRTHPVAPARRPTLSLDSAGVDLVWEASIDAGVVGYHVYKSEQAAGPYTRLTTTPVAATSYRHEVPAANPSYYMVRAIKLEQTPVGSYWNAGQGVFVKAESTTTNQAPVADSTVLNAEGPLAILATGSDPDGDDLSFTIASNASHGEVTGIAPNFTYTPDSEFEGSDQFQFNVWDGLQETVGTITIQVGEAQPGSSPEDELLQWSENFDWQGEDSAPEADPDGDGLSNRWEYYLARDPLTQNTLFSKMENASGSNDDQLVVEFRRRKNLPFLSLEASPGSLNNWQTLQHNGQEVILETLSSNPESELMRLRWNPNEDISSAFFRFSANLD